MKLFNPPDVQSIQDKKDVRNFEIEKGEEIIESVDLQLSGVSPLNASHLISVLRDCREELSYGHISLAYYKLSIVETDDIYTQGIKYFISSLFINFFTKYPQ